MKKKLSLKLLIGALFLAPLGLLVYEFRPTTAPQASAPQASAGKRFAATGPAYFINQRGEIDAIFYGVKGDGSDQWAALQGIANWTMTLPKGTKPTIVLPPGVVRVSQRVNFTWQAGFVGFRGTGATLFTGSFPGPVLGRNIDGTGNVGGCSVYLSGIDFSNGDPAGTAVQLEGLGTSVISNCTFKGNKGLMIGVTSTLPHAADNTQVAIRDCGFYGDGSANSIGCSTTGEAFVFSNIYGTGCTNVALQLAGNATLVGGDFVENVCAIRTGVAPGGTAAPAIVHIDMVDFEANLIHLEVRKPTHYSTFASLNIVGDRYLNSSDPLYGIDIQAGSNKNTFLSCVAGGGPYTASAIHVDTLAGVSLICTDATSLGVSSWTGAGLAQPTTTMLQCNYP